MYSNITAYSNYVEDAHRKKFRIKHSFIRTYEIIKENARWYCKVWGYSSHNSL